MSTQKELRDALIGGKKTHIPEEKIEINGNEYLVKGMTLKEFRKSMDDERDYSGVHEVIDHLYTPDGSEKIFSHTDVDLIKDLPAGNVDFVSVVQEKIMELTVGGLEEEKKVD